LARVFGPEGEQRHARATPGGRGRCLASGMAGANHYNVVHMQRLT
jgi:hypothetical protein